MLYALQLEVVGDNVNDVMRMWGEKPLRDQPWVARITGVRPSGDFDREHLDYHVDYSKANSRGSRGVRRVFWLEEGELYEVFEWLSWRRSRQYFCCVEDNHLIELTREGVIEGLRADG